MPSGVKFACSSNICCEHVFFYVGLKHEKRGQTGPDDGSNPETDATVLTVRLRERLNMKIHRFFHAWSVTAPQFNILRVLEHDRVCAVDRAGAASA